jgi:hypothetical protein
MNKGAGVGLIQCISGSSISLEDAQARVGFVGIDGSKRPPNFPKGRQV